MLDLSRPVQAKIGFPARIICTDLKAKKPIVAAISVPPDWEESIIFTYTLDGRQNALHEVGAPFDNYDLINVPDGELAIKQEE